MKYILIMLFLLPCKAFAVWECNALQEEYRLSPQQVFAVWKSYDFGKADNIGATLAALSFFESSAGKFTVNRKDPSAGHHHILLTHTLKRFALDDTRENRTYVMDALRSNFGLSASEASTIFLWWLDRHKGDWFKAVRSYNGGYYWKLPVEARKQNWDYAMKVTRLTKFIERNCEW